MGACKYDPVRILLKFDSKRRINSGGIAILIGLLTMSQKKGQEIFITGISKHRLEIFELFGLTDYVTVVESEEDASLR